MMPQTWEEMTEDERKSWCDSIETFIETGKPTGVEVFVAFISNEDIQFNSTVTPPDGFAPMLRRLAEYADEL
jgi:hypothetical protein